MDFDSHKAEGISQFSQGNFEAAAAEFTAALEIRRDARILSNRSACYNNLGQKEKALADADEALALEPTFYKAQLRRGAALEAPRSYHTLADAAAAYNAVLVHEPANAQAAAGLQRIAAAAAEFAAPLQLPGVQTTLAADPRVGQFFADPEFVARLSGVIVDPAGHLEAMRYADVTLAALAAQGMLKMLPEEFVTLYTTQMGLIPPKFYVAPPKETPAPTAPAPPHAPAPAPAPEDEDEDEDVLSEEDPELAAELAAERAAAEAARAEAEAAFAAAQTLKDEGNALYKARDFAGALEKYAAAAATCPEVHTYHLNQAVVLAAEKKFAEAAAAAEAAATVLAANRTHFSGLNTTEAEAKVLARLGTSLEAAGDLDAAIKAYERAQMVKRSRDVGVKLLAAKEARRVAREAARRDPEAAAAAKTAGDAAFREKNYALAVKEYSKSLEALPDVASVFLNRSLAFQRMLRVGEALRDVDRAIELDPKYAKAYLRRGQLQAMRKWFHKAIPDFSTAVNLAEEAGDKALAAQAHEAANTASVQMYKMTTADSQKLLESDPDLAKTASDPIIQHIIQQTAGNPSALGEHLQNPVVHDKIMQLIHAGVLRTAMHVQA